MRIHCYNCWRSNEDKKTSLQFNLMVTEDWFLRIAKIIVKNKTVSIIITGGEPFSITKEIKITIIYPFSVQNSLAFAWGDGCNAIVIAIASAKKVCRY